MKLSFAAYFSFKSFGKFKLAARIHHISQIHHIMEYLAEQFFIHSNFSLTPLLTDDILMNHKCFYYISCT